MIDFPHNAVLFINVYLPHYYDYNVDDYSFNQWKVMPVINELEICGVIAYGDFNEYVGGTYYTGQQNLPFS